MKIMVVGWFSDKYSGEGIAQGFEACGCEVIRVSTELCAPMRIERESKKTGKKIIKDPGRFDLHIQSHFAKSRSTTKSQEISEAYQLQLQNRRLKLINYTDQYPSLDWVFFIQNKFAWDFDGMVIPIYYFHTDIIATNLPLHAEKIHGFFYGYFGAADEMLNAYTYDFNHWVWKEFISYGVNADLLMDHTKQWQDRTTTIGFMGSLAQNPHSKDERMAHIYDNRIHYLKLLEDQFRENFVIQKFQEAVDYAKFMGNTKLAINIPGNWGKVNQRQFECLASCCLLVQWWYPELETEFGLIDKVNCLTFRNDAELLDQIMWALNHAEQAQAIAIEGAKLWLSQPWTWIARGKQFYNRITRPLTEQEEERQAWVEFQTKKEKNPSIEEEYPMNMMVMK